MPQDANVIGECIARPTSCDLNFEPVCACDGQTYSNECMAAMAGFSTVAMGECTADGPVPIDDGSLHRCDSTIPFDQLDIIDAWISGDELRVQIGYSGGCTTHIIGGCWDGMFTQRTPTSVTISVAHEANADACEAYVMQNRSYDLLPIAEAYRAANGGALDGTVMIRVAGFATALEYTF